MRKDALRSGDMVEVKNAAEILATLDDRGALDGLPFMPEMVELCGRRFAVDKRAEKICDTIHKTGSRRLPDTVLLADLRCNGSGHEGCQAECRLFWKEAWLRRVTAASTSASDDGDARAALMARAAQNAKATADIDGRPTEIHPCQATELYRASVHLRNLDPRPYLREYTSGNVPLGRFLKVIGRAAVQEPLNKLGLLRSGLRGSGVPGQAPPPKLGIQPGDWVQVKTKEEILATLSAGSTNRGLWFDIEMLPFCGGTFRVRRRVTRIIDEVTGKMINLKSDCFMLDGVVCSGDLSQGRWFCPREIYPYWRESWLRRADRPAGAP